MKNQKAKTQIATENSDVEVNVEEVLEIFFVRRQQVDDFSQQPRHSSYFYRGKWHRCSCPACKNSPQPA